MAGIDPMTYLEKVSFNLPNLTTNEQIIPVLDELEHLYEVLDPGFQHLADQLIEFLLFQVLQVDRTTRDVVRTAFAVEQVGADVAIITDGDADRVGLGDEHGRFIWPGFGENMRVLKWVIDRVAGSAHGVESPLGWVPTYDELNLEGLDFSKEDYYAIVNIDREVARHEANDQEELFTRFGDHLPRVMELEREQLIFRLFHSPKVWDLSSVCHPHD